MRSPINDKQCVYYCVKAYESVRSGKNRYWVLRFTEQGSLDFYISDPDAQRILVYVDGKGLPLRIHDLKEASRSRLLGLGDLFGSENYSAGVHAFCQRNNFDLQTSFLGIATKKKMLFVESAFDLNEQVALLGIVQSTQDCMGNPIFKLMPVSFNINNST